MSRSNLYHDSDTQLELDRSGTFLEDLNELEECLRSSLGGLLPPADANGGKSKKRRREETLESEVKAETRFRTLRALLTLRILALTKH